MNKFLFIIPLSPEFTLNENRKAIQNICFNYLFNQDYYNWQALVIGNEFPVSVSSNSKFIHIKYEGLKEEKIQVATKFIIENKIHADYIIRLDDDDFFNPYILQKLKDKDFDIFTDKFHTFYEFETQSLSQQIRLWFPNTCIHKFEHAMAIYGTLANVNIKNINEHVRLIENNHAKFHEYYKGKRIIFANKRNPLYLRVLNRESITAKSFLNYELYLKQFGFWKKNKLISYQIISSFNNEKIYKLNYSLKEKLLGFYQQLKLYMFYKFYLYNNK